MPIFSGVTISGGFTYEAPPPPVIPYVAVAVTGTNRIMTSTDASSWTGVLAPQVSAWESIAYGNSTFVALSGDQNSANPYMYSTDDGANWTVASKSGANSFYGNRIRFLNNQFIAMFDSGTQRLATSSDGITWTAISTNLLTYSPLDMTYVSGTYYALVSDGNISRARILTSPDLTTWTAVAVFNISPTSMTNGHTLQYSNGTFIVAGDNTFASPQTNAELIYSTDGTTWTAATNATALGTRYNVVYGNGTWVSVGLGQNVATSSDGITWTNSATALPNNSTWRGLVYKNNRFVAVSTGGHVAYSTDGLSWTAGTASEANGWYAIA